MGLLIGGLLDQGAAVKLRSFAEELVEQSVHAFNLSAQQVQFLILVKQHITDHGMLRIEDLYEAPFTQLHSDGVDGVFTDEAQVTRLINIIETFDPSKVRSA